jgi:hypothetical protein
LKELTSTLNLINWKAAKDTQTRYFQYLDLNIKLSSPQVARAQRSYCKRTGDWLLSITHFAMDYPSFVLKREKRPSPSA